MTTTLQQHAEKWFNTQQSREDNVEIASLGKHLQEFKNKSRDITVDPSIASLQTALLSQVKAQSFNKESNVESVPDQKRGMASIDLQELFKKNAVKQIVIHLS